MEIGKAIYNILSTTTNISDLVGTRIFPNVAPQTTTFPFIIYDVTGVQPNDTKDGASTLDTNDVMISCYSETYSQASDLAQKIRVAMDRITMREHMEVNKYNQVNFKVIMIFLMIQVVMLEFIERL